MQLQGRHYKKPMMEIVSFEKFDVAGTDAKETVIFLDTSRHQNFVIMLNTKNDYGIRYKIEVANIDSDGKETNWTTLLGEEVLEGNKQAVITRVCVSERARLLIENDIAAEVASVDIFVRLNPFGTIV